MKVSIVTPSYNQAQFLPINLESIRNQTWQDLEHIIVDPGSTDGSTDIARQSPNIKLINEPDRGQSDGICKGFAQASGDILAWLNSDDFYPNKKVIESVVECFKKNPKIDIVYGLVNFVDENGSFLKKGFVNSDETKLFQSFRYQVGIVQPGVFWRRHVFEDIGGPSDEFEYCMDYELWVRMASNDYQWKHLPDVLAHHRWWDGMKTSSHRDLSLREHFKVCYRYFGYVHWKWLDRYADFLYSNQDGVVNHAVNIPTTKKTEYICKAIDEVVTQTMLREIEISSDAEKKATFNYIKTNYPDKCRIYFTGDDLDIIEEKSDDPEAMSRVAWNIFSATEKSGKRYFAYHVLNGFDRYFDQQWLHNQLKRTEQALTQLAERRRSDTCVIVGNGPSLRKNDLSLLAYVDNIISNFAVMDLDLNQQATILTIVNDLVAKQGAVEFNASPHIKIVPFWLANYFNEQENTFFVKSTVRPEFGFDFVNHASWRSTVSFFNMQLAYALGYKKVLLIGFDHSYTQPKGMTEGMVITQKNDDENHFDPRYFKGKQWQAADVNNMEAMYKLAKSAFEADGREIVNCTVGGKLDLFRRGDLATELDVHPLYNKKSSQSVKDYPRLLMIDSTSLGHLSATGQLKAVFLEQWSSDCFLQVWEAGGKPTTLHLADKNSRQSNNHLSHLTIQEIISRCLAFNPDVIYVRPIASHNLMMFAELIVALLNKPLILHMMDDWPELLQQTDPTSFHKLDGILRRLIKRADQQLSISEAMSKLYQQRYGDEWLPLANGVDIADFPAKDWQKRPPVSPSNPFVIRYMGALADNMTYASVLDIAQAVASLQDKLPLRFEIYTMDWAKHKIEKAIQGIDGVVVKGLVPKSNYIRYLCEADALVIAYNFDPDSVRYIGVSLANKMPECLASGVPLLAYGPSTVATIDYLQQAGCAQVVNQRNPQQLCEMLERLATDFVYCEHLATKARQFAATHLAKADVQQHFFQIHQRAVSANKRSATLLGPFQRYAKAHLDETSCVQMLYNNIESDLVMIDVGAHHGGSFRPFLNKGWQIFAFEPDPKNRSKLLEWLVKHNNNSLVQVDTRCVSNESQKGQPFYSSNVSTGISGLSAFHESHQQSQLVDTVTLTDFLQDKSLQQIDFLKIDTEGHDLFALQGFPWEQLQPAVIECEFEDAKTVPLGYNFHDIATYLVEKGYQVYVSEWHPIVRYGIRHDWHSLARYPCELANANGWGNLLAFREPIDESELMKVVQQRLKFGQQNKVASVSSALVETYKAKSTNQTILKPIKKIQDLLLANNRVRHIIIPLKEKTTGLWLGTFLTAILMIYGMTSLPGRRIAGVISTLPFMFAWRRRNLRRLKDWMMNHSS